MKLDIKLCSKTINCGIKVIDYTGVSDDGYQMENNDNVIKGRYKKSDTHSFNLLIYNSTKGSDIYTFTKSNNIQFSKDGWFTYCRILVPTKEWVEKGVSGIYSKVICSDGVKLFKYETSNYIEIDPSELLEMELEDSSVSFYKIDYVNVCHLKNCYIELCKKVYNSVDKCFNYNVDKNVITRRDLVYMTISVVSYLTECGLLAEAQRTIENISTCNGLCTDDITHYNNEKKCNCSKK